MKNLKFFLPVLLLLLSVFWFMNKNIVSYEVTPGRFGDNLLTYLHAKWFSYEHKIPLLYRPFPYSSFLSLDDTEVHFKDKKKRKNLRMNPHFKTKVKKWSSLSKWPLLSFHYKCPYFPESEWEKKHLKYFSFPVNWKDPQFRKIVKELIAPKETLQLTLPPTDCISIAMHVREGGGFDTDAARLIVPLKLPPLDFYTEGLKYIVSLFPEKSLYCHIFTDALEPEKIVDQMKQAIGSNEWVKFDYRKEQNHHEANVLEDFFSLFHFDILIRSQSNYSLIPSLIHDYAVIYSPKDCEIKNNSVKITELEIETNKELIDRLHAL